MPAEPAAPDEPRLAPRTSGTAIASVAFSLLGFTCLPAIGGLIAVALGFAARSEIASSQGRSRGNGLALTGIVLGALGVCGGIAAASLIVARLDEPDEPEAPVAATAAPAPVPSPTPSGAAPDPGDGGAPRVRGAGGGRSDERGVIETKIGSIVLADVMDVDARTELVHQQEIAAKEHRTLVLWLVTEGCKPCNGVAAALTSPELQTALAGTRLVRMDTSLYGKTLRRLDIPVDRVPGFALFDEGLRTSDYVDGGEWGEDVARNIAPVLGPFVRHTYTQRRNGWSRPKRDGETPL